MLLPLGIVACGRGGSLPADRPPQPLPQCIEAKRLPPADSVHLLMAGQRPPENRLLRLSRTVPGGFLSVESGRNGQLVIRMVDTTKADTVRTALATSDSAEPPAADAVSRLQSAELEQVRFSRAELDDWASYLFALVVAGGNNVGVRVSGVGANPYYGRVDILVPTETDRTWVETKLASAAIPCGLVAIELGRQE